MSGGGAPTFSVITPVYDPPLDILRETVRSVLAQRYDDWELILVDDCSPDPEVRVVLRELAATDDRIRVIERETNGHIVAASNDGIDAARGEFIALLDHDDLLVPRALRAMKAAIDANPEADYLYSDERLVNLDGSKRGDFRKPDWSPERLRGQMYTCHLSVLRTTLVREVGGFHDGFDGSQDHDLVLRVTERARRVVHVPKVLYHWRAAPGSTVANPDAKPYAWTAGRDAVQAHLDRVGVAARAELGPYPGTYELHRRLDPDVRVSVVIPTRGGEGIVWGERRCFVVEAVRSVLALGGHENVEIIVVHDAGTPAHVLDELRTVAGSTLQLVPYAKKFNFSEKCNLGVVRSYGEVVVLLNDDIEIVSPNFLVELVAPLFEDGVGQTGAHLLFSDSSVQHAGLVFFKHGPGHMFYKKPAFWKGPFNAMAVNRECSGLTGACVALKRSTYEEVGGLSEDLPLSYNDVDLSHKIGAAGYRRLWIANAKAYHFESKSREPTVQPWELEFVRTRWKSPDHDVYMPLYGPTAKRRAPAPRGRRSGSSARMTRRRDAGRVGGR